MSTNVYVSQHFDVEPYENVDSIHLNNIYTRPGNQANMDIRSNEYYYNHSRLDKENKR